MPEHVTQYADQEDQRLGRKQARAPWFVIGFASALGIVAALVFWGVV